MPNRPNNPPRVGFTREERIDPNLKTLLHVAHRQFKMEEIPVLDDDPERPKIIMSITRSIGSMELTVLTVEELEALRKFFNDVIDRAVSISSVLDAEAKAGLERGETNFKRLWRPDPRRIDF